MVTKNAFSWLVGDEEQVSEVVTWEKDPHGGKWYCLVSSESNIEMEIKRILTNYAFTEEDKPLLTELITDYITSLRALRAANQRRERTRGVTSYELDYLLEVELLETRGTAEAVRTHEEKLTALLDMLRERGYSKRHIRLPAHAKTNELRTDGQEG